MKTAILFPLTAVLLLTGCAGYYSTGGPGPAYYGPSYGPSYPVASWAGTGVYGGCYYRNPGWNGYRYGSSGNVNTARGGSASWNDGSGSAHGWRGSSASWNDGSGSAQGWRGGSASWNHGSGSAESWRGGTASWGGGSGSWSSARGGSGSWHRR